MAGLKSVIADRVVISCEHASNRLPSAYRNLGLEPDTLASHIAWDPGARRVAMMFAKKLRCPVHEGAWSRLLIDLNRSIDHRALIAKFSFDTRIPGNSDIDRRERELRVRKFWQPYREAVRESVKRRIARAGSCLHLSVHSFTPAVGGTTRTAEVGVLYDPGRRRERELAVGWVGRLRARGVRARCNYPYRGTADGLVTAFRADFPASRYLGLELEVNQGLLSDRKGFLHMVDVTLASFLDSLRQDPSSRRRLR